MTKLFLIIAMLISLGAYANPAVEYSPDVTAKNATLVCSKASSGKLLCKPVESGVVELTTKNLIVLRGPITAQSASKFVATFNKLEHRDEVQRIYIYVNSPGGSIFAGDYITNAIGSSQKEVVVLINFAASMAFHIAQFADKKLMFPTGTMMQHHASGGPGSGEFPNVENRWDWIKRKIDMMNRKDAAGCTKTSFSQFKKNIDRDWWLLSDEAVAAGCIDAIATQVSCSKDLSEQRVVEKLARFGMSIELTWSGCPLETYPINVKLRRVGLNRLSPDQLKQAQNYVMLVSDPLQYYKYYGTFSLTDPVETQ